MFADTFIKMCLMILSCRKISNPHNTTINVGPTLLLVVVVVVVAVVLVLLVVVVVPLIIVLFLYLRNIFMIL